MSSTYTVQAHVRGTVQRDRADVTAGGPIAISQFLSLRATFLSSAVMDPRLAAEWTQTAARYRPLGWAVVASRVTLLGSPDWGLVWPRLGAPALLAVLMAWAAARMSGAYQRSL